MKKFKKKTRKGEPASFMTGFPLSDNKILIQMVLKGELLLTKYRELQNFTKK